MSQVSRPMQIALAATLLLAVVWFVALRPKPAADAGSAAAPAPAATQQAPDAPGVKGLTTAIQKAHGAVATANGAATTVAPAAGATGATATAPSKAAATPAAPARHAARHRHKLTAAERHVAAQVAVARAAVRHRKALAIAFVDPATADGRAVAAELSHVSRFGGRAVLLSVPLGTLSSYGFITRDVQVVVAPTIVIVAPSRKASTIVGFADRGEIEQRVSDVLARHRK